MSSVKTDARDYKAGGGGFEVVGEAGGSATGVPFHRLWIFSRFVVRPIVILGASGKYVTMKLSSRRRVVRIRSRRRGGGGGGKGMEYFDDDFFDDEDSTIPDDERFSQIIVQLHSDLNRKLDVVWEYLPPVQMVLAVFTLLAAMWFIDYASDLMTSRRAGYGGSSDSTWSGWQTAFSGSDGGYGHVNDRNQGSMAPHSNAYQHSREQLGLNNDLMALRFQATKQNFAHIADKKQFFYGSPGIFCVLGIVCTISSLIVYGRILLPLPDMVSNTCGFNPGKVSGKSLKSQRVGKPWSETYKSIESEDRFHLYAKVTFLRILENLFLCAILPQTEYVCKATGHCETDVMIFELNGIPSVTGVKGQSMFDNIIQDRLSAFIIAVSVISVTTLTLISQAATLDRSFLSRKGYVDSGLGSNEISYSDSGRSGLSAKRSSAFDSLSSSGSSRKIKRYDDSFVVGNSWISTRFNFSSSLGKFRHFVNRVFANEVGPLSTSRILAVSSHIHLLQIIFIMFVLVMYTVFNKNFYALGLTFVAVVNSSGAMDIGVLEYDELQTIADEISQ